MGRVGTRGTQHNNVRQKMNPIIRLDVPESEYRAHPYVANSDLSVVRRRSPAHAVVKREEPSPDTPAKLDGRALHCAILEPNDFARRYCAKPADAPRDLRHHRNAKSPSPDTLFSIRWWDDFEAANAGKIILDQADIDEKLFIADRIRSHPRLRGFFDAPGVNEASLFAHDPETGAGVKARHDRRVVIGGYRVCLDPKSTEDARADAFMRSAYNYDYFQQAAFYTDISEWCGEPLDLFLFIAFEKVRPYAVKVYEVQANELSFGREQYRIALNTWAECVKNNEFPGYDDDIEPLPLPSYAKVA